MPIEVRQIVIRSTVEVPLEAAPRPPRELGDWSADRLKAETLAECKAWFEEKLQQLRER